MRASIIAVLFVLIGGPLFIYPQSKKEIDKYKIKSVTENVTLYDNSKQITFTASYTRFNKDGKIIETVHYNKDGGIKKKETFKYDSYRNKTEETYFEEPKSGKNISSVTTKTAFKYNKNKKKIEECEYDAQGKMLKKIAFGYNSMGERISEICYDSEGKIIQRIIYDYDNNSLKAKREVYLSDNTIESVKKYTYEFY